tara:strand:+ start:9819 stop:10697 length:879 start_codon:yes stop_codon:yes gene_type:complete
LIGIFAALLASLSWTYACSIWRSQTNLNTPIQINFFKNLLAFLIFVPTLFLFDYSSDYRYFLILLISGIIGIGLGDTFYLKSLNLIGTRKTLSIEALSPLIAAIAGQLFMNEKLSIKVWFGIVIVSLTLISIIKKQNYLLNKNSKLLAKKVNFRELKYSFLSVICAVIAASLSRFILLKSDFSPIHTTEIRLLGALIFLSFTLKKMKLNFSLLNLTKENRVSFLLSVLIGTNLGIFLQQVVFQQLPLGIGWTLLSTSPIFSLYFAKKEEGSISRETILLTILLFFGVSLVIL